MLLVERTGVPLAIHVAAANQHEVRLAEPTLTALRAARLPHAAQLTRVIADRAYDSQALWARLRTRGIALIAPHRRYRRRRQVWQDGRALRRYRHRWIVERTNAWLLSFRRLATRHERQLERYRAFVHVACLVLALRRL